MKNVMKFFGVMVMALFAASCAKTEEIGGGAEGGNGSISFTFEGLKHSPTTYVAVTPGKDEDKVDFTKSDIYMFDNATGLLEARIPMADNNVTTVVSGSGYTVTLKGIKNFNATEKVFYFVANNKSVSDIDATVGTTTEAEFMDRLTNQLTVTSDIMENIRTPLLFTGKSDVISPANATTATVTMKRRVARFDIVNPYTTFEIKKIYISGAKQQGLVFSNSTADPVIAAYSTEELDFTSSPLAYETILGDRITRSVFYLYPTKIGETQISIEASYNGAPDKLYYVDSNIDILANHRYKLVLNDNMTFSLVFAEWDEGDTAPVVPDTRSRLSMTSFTSDDALGHFTLNSYRLTPGENPTLKVVLKTFDPNGAEASVSFSAGADNIVDEAAITAGVPVVTYSDVYYTQEFTIPVTYPADIPGAEVIVTFKDTQVSSVPVRVMLYSGNFTRAAAAEANTYMLEPGGDAIDIPLTRAYAFWNDNTRFPFETAVDMAADAAFDMKYLWSDIPGGLGAEGGVEYAFVKGVGENAVLTVKPGMGQGNTLLAASDKETGNIKWSWLIWNTDYDPNNYTAVPQPGKFVYKEGVKNGFIWRGKKHTQMPTDIWTGAFATTFIMDRNIGERSNFANGNDFHGGLLFQFGRKDPFTFYVQHYNEYGEALNKPNTDPVKKVVRSSSAIGHPSLAELTTNPDTFFGIQASMGVSQGAYLLTTDNSAPNLFWHDNQGASGKSLFDPCPAGWRLPSYTSMYLFHDLQFREKKTEFSDNWYPYQAWDFNNEGVSYIPSEYSAEDLEGETIWFPVRGLRFRSSGRLSNDVNSETLSTAVKKSGMWSAHAYNNSSQPYYSAGNSYIAYYTERYLTEPEEYYPGGSGTAHVIPRSFGMGVRCINF